MLSPLSHPAFLQCRSSTRPSRSWGRSEPTTSPTCIPQRQIRTLPMRRSSIYSEKRRNLIQGPPQTGADATRRGPSSPWSMTTWTMRSSFCAFSQQTCDLITICFGLVSITESREVLSVNLPFGILTGFRWSGHVIGRTGYQMNFRAS